MKRLIQLSLVALATLAPAAIPAQTHATGLNDATIVGIFDAANGWDVSTGALASSKASRKDVRDFGAQLASVHAAVQKQGRDLAGTLGVKPEPVAPDFALKQDFDATMKKLHGLGGANFDRAFLEHEIAYHRAVIDAIQAQFLPAIHNAELKAFVEKLVPAFDAHMQMAKALLAK